MEENKSQNKCSHTKSETYQTKHSKQKSKSSLNKRRNTAVALSIVSSVILTGIGYEIVTSFNSDSTVKENHQQVNAPLRILADEDNFGKIQNRSNYQGSLDFEEEIDIIQQLTRHKNLQAKKIRELKEDLDEAQGRIVQLKTDILIKGGRKEQAFQEQISALEKQLANSEQETTFLRTEIAARDKVIESKRFELEQISKIFTDTHEKLQSELTERDSRLEQEQIKTEKIFADLREELDLTDAEISRVEDVRDAIYETKKRISELEDVIEESNNIAIEERNRAEELTRNLLITQSNFEKARETIQNLTTQIETENLIASYFKRQFQENMNTQQSDDNDLLLSMNIQQNTTTNNDELRNLQTQLQEARTKYTTEKIRADELENRLQNMDASTALSTNWASDEAKFSSISTQQEKLIRDLQRNLNNVERRNKKLEELVKKQSRASDGYYVPTHQAATDDDEIEALQMELRESQDKIVELENQIQRLLHNQDLDYIGGIDSRGSTSESKETQNLVAERNSLLTKVYEYQSQVQDQQEIISRLQQNLEEAKSTNNQLKHSINGMIVSSHNENEVIDLRDRVFELEQSLAATERKLQDSQKKLYEQTSSDNGLVEMEEFYDTKIEQLVKANQILEEQLDETEEYLKITQSQLQKKTEQINSLNKEILNSGYNNSSAFTSSNDSLNSELAAERNQRMQLERELALLRERFQSSQVRQSSNRTYANSSTSQQVLDLQEQLRNLQEDYAEEQRRTSNLETQLETMGRLTTNLQEEIAAQEASFDTKETTSTPSKLRAKISYLTTRLAQERMKLMNTEEKLQEVMFTLDEMKQRNQNLDQQLHYR